MSSFETLAPFIGTAALVVVTPGLDTAIVLRTSALESPKHGAVAALGIGLGCLCWGAAAAAGLSILLSTSKMAFGAVKIVGALYLSWLGLNYFLHPRAALHTTGEAGPGPIARTMRAAFQRGLLTNLLNPKVGLFYITLLPQFIPHGVEAARYSFFLSCVHVFLAVLWFVLLANAAGRAKRLLQRPGVVPAIDRVTGGIFVGLAIKLAAD